MRLRALVTCGALVAGHPALVRAQDPEPAPSTSTELDAYGVDELERRAQEAFAAERYDEVVVLAAEAYERTGEVRHLYAQAHAERFRGNCKDALALYARVMAADPEGTLGKHARDGIKLCEGKLDEPPAPEVPPPAAPPRLPPPDAAPRRAAPDALAISLLAIGTAALAAGASLGVVAGTRARQLAHANDEHSIVVEQRRARAFEGAAIGVSVLGTALIVGGIVRLVQRRRHRDH